MSPEERQMLVDLFERVRGAAASPRDPQAEAFINDAVRALPYAPYALAQTVLVQQHALEAAGQRISELEAQARTAPAAPPQGETSFLGNIGRSLFGGGPAAPAPQPARAGNPYDASGYQRGAAAPAPGYAPQPQAYAPAPQPGPWGAPAPSAGGGFLSGALHTAAGVAGGMVLANAVEGLLGGRGGLFGGSGLMGGGGGFMPSAFAEPRETINNYYVSGADPAGQHAEDVLQDMDQDQDDAQDASFDDGGSSDFSTDA